jgi:2-oxo-4-hydroxy-4-carboxy--5-ureidoimidazoline (OHCU) decarboxylase
MRPSRTIVETLFENAPRFADQLVNEEADSYDDLIVIAEQAARNLPEDEQLELINGHPRIGAQPASISAQSFREQGYDRDPETNDLQARLDRLNEEYERRFGFRFVIYVAGRPRSEIANLMENRLQASREDELERALSDVFAIARDRMSQLRPGQQEAR